MAHRTTITGVGVYGATEMQVEPMHRAGRISLRPTDKSNFGSYSAVFATAAFAAGALAAAPLLAFRWNASQANCLVRRIKGAVSVTTAFAQGDTALDIIRGQSVTAQYTGGAVITLGGKSQGRTTRFAATQQQIGNSAGGNIAVANTAALAAPTPAWTFDNFALARLDASGTLGLNTSVIFEANPWDEPLELQAGEGFLIRATTPATGVPTFIFTLDWDEVDAERYFGAFG